MHNFTEIFKNYCLMSVALAWITAQILKIFTGYFKGGKVSVTKFLCGTGGMPSSHSATVSALATASGWQYGLASFQFAVSVLLAIIVMSDAAGVRLETGKQARIINKILPEIFSGKGNMEANLKELIGHTPFQVFVGAVLGILVAVVLKLLAF